MYQMDTEVAPGERGWQPTASVYWHFLRVGHWPSPSGYPCTPHLSSWMGTVGISPSDRQTAGGSEGRGTGGQDGWGVRPSSGGSPQASQAGDAGQLQADSTQTTLWRPVLPPPQTAGGGGCTHLPTHCYQSFISLQCKCLEMGLQNPIRINSSPRDAITGILTLSLSFIKFSEFLLKKEHISLFTIRRTIPFPL